MHPKTILFLAAMLGLSLNLMGQTTAREQMAANPYLCGSNHLDYDNYPATAKLTKAPKGYEPYL
ncbi:MAG: histidine-type phosphatase, partial [Bacteroidales bacterium]|nr:histidine-type phosphatase [Bacteroidales bacterium]